MSKYRHERLHPSSSSLTPVCVLLAAQTHLPSKRRARCLATDPSRNHERLDRLMAPQPYGSRAMRNVMLKYSVLSFGKCRCLASWSSSVVRHPSWVVGGHWSSLVVQAFCGVFWAGERLVEGRSLPGCCPSDCGRRRRGEGRGGSNLSTGVSGARTAACSAVRRGGRGTLQACQRLK